MLALATRAPSACVVTRRVCWTAAFHMLVPDYDSSGSDDDDDEGDNVTTNAAAIAAAAAARSALLADDDDDDEDEEDEPEAAAAATAASSSGAADSAQYEEPQATSDDAHGGSRPAPREPLELPPQQASLPAPDLPPDFFDPAAPARPTAPTVFNRSRAKRGGSSSQAQISSGFKAATTRHDQLRQARDRELEEEADARGRNNGLSSAYDSVFRADGNDEEERKPKKSKKENARDKALEASLRG